MKRNSQIGSSMELRLGFATELSWFVVSNVLFAVLCNILPRNQKASSLKWCKLQGIFNNVKGDKNGLELHRPNSRKGERLINDLPYIIVES